MDKYAELKPFSRGEASNLFSNWFPKVKDCGINVPKSVVIQTPKEMFEHFYMENPAEDIAAVQKWVREEVIPAAEKRGVRYGTPVFIKNGSFSNKFDAGTSCMTMLTDNMAMNIINIMYGDAMFDVGGMTELVIRERIQHDACFTPTIYSGLPLRTEFRVFYDFDTHEVIFCANYWDYQYCYPHLYDRTDKIVFDAVRDELEKRYEANKDAAMELVRQHMADVTGLSGPWSIDLMLTEDNQFYLIDMALAERSAYWEFRPGAEKGEKA